MSMSAGDQGIGFLCSPIEDGDTLFIVVESTMAGDPTGAAVVIPVDAAPAAALALLDIWNEWQEDN